MFAPRESLPHRPAATAAASAGWRYTAWAELDEALAACRAEWLSLREHAILAAWRNPRRRRAWLGGRLVAKRVVQSRLAADARLDEIEILAAAGGRPAVLCRARSWPCPLSISHTEQGVLVAVGAPGDALGVDLTPCQAPNAGFVRLWFTPGETARLRAEPWLRASALWAAKEALYKACNAGEGFDPRQCEILADGCRYRGRSTGAWLQSWTEGGQDVALVCVASAASTLCGAAACTTSNLANCS